MLPRKSNNRGKVNLRLSGDVHFLVMEGQSGPKTNMLLTVIPLNGLESDNANNP